jgi:hypothetical protein
MEDISNMTQIQLQYMAVDDSQKKQTPEEINAMIKMTHANLKREQNENS